MHMIVRVLCYESIWELKDPGSVRGDSSGGSQDCRKCDSSERILNMMQFECRAKISADQNSLVTMEIQI